MNGIIQITSKTRASTNIIKLVRCVSLFSGNCKKNEKIQGNFIPVYKFPYILPFSMINRLKVYQTALTAISIPVTVCLNQLDQISSGAVQFTVALGFSGCLALYSLGYLTQNFIGYIYYNEEKDVAKISYIDSWGKRKDIEIPTKDIVPFNELPSTFLDGLYFTFRRFSTKETLKFSLNFGIILDKEKIKRVM
ncbi:transmembrane protein 186 [Anoplophora glabripennis]|uniref:transmembrane protein 186 n=1 Tax=Anoplophora glabripennis TaxID=217634 RepID=UPI0008755D11|nr:transmembrane protein 186 [Anoplophora glabripennis]